MNKTRVPFVSVCMITYNHESYISKAIEGILHQKTNFNFEIIIGEDFSTDKTRFICKTYQSKYPDKIKLLLPQKNTGVQENFINTLLACCGKYIAFCEGDDFWTDPLKLQKQIDFLEDNPVYSLCFTRFKIYDQTSNTLIEDSNQKYFNENQKEIEFTFDLFYKGWQLGTQTMVFRQAYIKEFNKERKKYKYWKDIHLITFLLNKGKAVCLNFYSAVYRVHPGGIYSGASRLKNAKISYQCYKEIYQHNKSNHLLKLKHQRFTEYYIIILIENHRYLLSLWICIKSKPENILKTLIEIVKELFKSTKMNLTKALKFIIRKDTTRKRIRNFYQKTKDWIIKLKPIEKPPFFLKAKNFGLTEVKREKEIIISLTSFPPRIKHVKYTIQTLLNQTLKPDKIILWLAETEFPKKEKNLPKSLLKLKKYGLSIEWYNENIKAYKKLIPSLEKYPNDIIVTVDDDVFYQPTWLEILYKSYNTNKNAIHCHRAHRIKTANNDVLSYNNWEYGTSLKEASFLNFLTGVGGVLYSPSSLHTDVLKKELFKEYIPSNDDIWFWAMALLNDTKIKVVENAQTPITVDKTQDESLWMINVVQGQNDHQLNQIFKLYPILKEKIKEELK